MKLQFMGQKGGQANADSNVVLWQRIIKKTQMIS
jgi:hypothetical protein